MEAQYNPMIDPAISLAVKPVDYDPLQARAQQLGIQNLLAQQRLQPGQQQIQQQTIQSNTLGLQQQQIQLNQIAARNAAYQSALTTQPDGTVGIDQGKLSTTLGSLGHAELIPEIMKNTTDYQESLAKLQQTQGDVGVLQRDAAGSLGAAVKAAGYDPQLFSTLFGTAVANKQIPPALAAQITGPLQRAWANDPSGGLAKEVVKHAADQFIAGSPKQMQLANEATTAQGALLRGQAMQATSTDANQKANQAAADKQIQDGALKLRQAAALGEDAYKQELAQQPQPVQDAAPRGPFDPVKTPQLIDLMGTTSAQRLVDSARLATEANAAKPKPGVDVPYPPAVEEQRKRLQPQINLTVPGLGPGTPSAANPQLTGDAFLAILPPGTAAQVKQIASGATVIPPFGSRGASALLRDAVFRYDKTFTDQSNQLRHGTLAEFNSTAPNRAGGQVLALNTMIHHADLYMDAGDALKNGTFVPGNAAYNAISTMMGQPAPNNVALISQFLAGETGKLATGGVPAEGEVNRILGPLKNNNSPDQLRNAGQTLLGIASGRMIPLKEKAVQGQVGNLVQVVGPDAAGILQRRGYDPATMKPVQQGGAPPGTIHYVEGADHWDIPADRKAAFEKSHPNAKAQ